ncbi:hypothetical protein DAI22_11g138850 [Oryza sativa Japonica Group]|nr:hypothetical protein DAI22_11g138850 [Oryza sativa Japonica Group]
MPFPPLQPIATATEATHIANQAGGQTTAKEMAGLFASMAIEGALDSLSSLLQLQANNPTPPPATTAAVPPAETSHGSVKGGLEDLRALERTMRRIHATLRDAEQHWRTPGRSPPTCGWRRSRSSPTTRRWRRRPLRAATAPAAAAAAAGSARSTRYMTRITSLRLA